MLNCSYRFCTLNNVFVYTTIKWFKLWKFVWRLWYWTLVIMIYETSKRSSRPLYEVLALLNSLVTWPPFRKWSYDCRSKRVMNNACKHEVILHSNLYFLRLNWNLTSLFTKHTEKFCHLEKQWHVQLDATAVFAKVARKEDEQAFVHRGSWIPNKGLDKTMPATANCI